MVGGETCLQTASICEQNSAPRQHTHNTTPTLKTPYTPLYARKNHKSSKHCSHSYVHTGCIAKQANLLSRTNANTNALANDCKQSDCHNKKTTSFLGRPHHWDHHASSNRGSQIPQSESHVKSSQTHPTTCEKQRNSTTLIFVVTRQKISQPKTNEII